MLHRALASLCLVLAGVGVAQERQPLRVLYAGQPGHSRTAAFTTFLGEHFAKVGTTDFRTLDREHAKDWDVVVLDLPPDLPFDDYRTTELPKSFDRPTVLVGSWAARLAEKAKLKIDDG